MELVTLKLVMECPAKAAYSMKRKRDTVSETDVYLSAVTNALHSLAGMGQGMVLQDMRDSWVAAIKRTKMRTYVHPASFPLLVSKGIRVLWTVFTTVLQGSNTMSYGRAVVDVVGGVVSTDIIAIRQGNSEVGLVLLDNPLPMRRQPARSDPERMFMRLHGKPFYCLSLHSGAISGLHDTDGAESDKDALGSLVAHATLIRKGAYHPRVGLRCKTCGWRKACHQEFKEV